MKRLFVLLLVPALLTSCSTLRQTFGADKTAPDEFAVVERAPLTVPPDFNLIPPEPGAPRPQESLTTDQAQKLVIGTPTNAPVMSKNMSPAEKALLSQANAGGVDATIRQELNKTDDQEVDGSFSQKLGITGGAETGKALDADAESQRLKKEKVKTPNVPAPKKAE